MPADVTAGVPADEVRSAADVADKGAAAGVPADATKTIKSTAAVADKGGTS
ncbi:hypothetical protein [Dactylosporangium sp. NPDC050588]|uniref:hypothetical protein n=1 Tax=Dactylosporangium sp. NPDC050588 TaxID=3157211 RepID=UPI0033C2AD8B